MRRLLPLLLLATALAPAPGWAAAQTSTERGTLLLRTFPPRTYRGHEQIWAAAETAGGTMVFGSLNTVLEFDGLSWRSLDIPGGSYIRALTADATGTVWLAGVNELGQLVPGPDGRLRYKSLRPHVSTKLGNLGAIWCVHALADGVWFQSDKAVLRWHGGEFATWTMDERSVVLSLPWRDGLLVARPGGWFTPRPGGQWEQIGGEELGKILPRALLPHGEGRWLVLTPTEGFKLFDGRTLSPFPTPIDAWLTTKKPYAAERLKDGRVLITSLQGGALLTAPDFSEELALDETAGLLTSTAIRGAQDRFGALWLGTDRGIVRVEIGSPFTQFTPASGIGRDGAETIDRIGGRLVVGGSRGMLQLEPPAGRPGHARFAPRGEATDKFNTYLQLPDGILVGGITGLHWIAGGRTERLPSPSNVREVTASRVHPGRFYGTHLDGLTSWRRAKGDWVWESAWPAPRGELRGLFEQADGTLWTSTPNAGVRRVTPAADPKQPARVEEFGEAQGLPAGRDRVFIVSLAGELLFSTPRGLYRFDARTGRFAADTKLGLAPVFESRGRVRVMDADDRGGLWAVVDPAESLAVRLFYAADGTAEQVPLPDAEALGRPKALRWERRDGREALWFALESGILRLDIEAWRAAHTTRPSAPEGTTILRGFETRSGRHALAGPTVALRPEDNSVRFAFATPWLAGEPQVVHETRLIGFSGGEVQLGPAAERAFTNLPPGRYTFEAKGRSADGRWSAPARLAFTVLAPWWQSGWAYAGGALGIGGLVFAYVRWRLRRLLRERTRLEAVVAERTTELARKNHELERLNRLEQDEKLAARLAEEKARLELLRYQLNPHFLFNSLNSIRALVYANPESAGEMVTRLAEFCRWTLTRGSDETTTVAEEMEMVRTYLDIEKARWQDALATRLDIAPEAQGERLPQFLLLPLIENAIKYGSRTSPELLRVEVTARIEDGFLFCEVANSGTWVEPASLPAPTSTHIGLENLRQRLARHYGPGCELGIVRADGWVRMQLRLKRGLAAFPASARMPFPNS